MTKLPRRAWTACIAVVALVAVWSLMIATALGAPATQTYTGASSATPDNELDGLTLYRSDGSVLTTQGNAGTINFTLNGVPLVGYCSDIIRILSTGTEAVDATTGTPASAAERAVTWILLNRTPTGAPSAISNRQAATSQIAIWELLDPRLRASAPTNDVALNNAAAALVTEAKAATATPATLTLSAVPPAAGATTATVQITGKPFATVALSIGSGTATLSASSVTLDASGKGSVAVTSATPGNVTVAASTAGDGTLTRINPTDAERMPQPTVAAAASQVAATQLLAFIPAAVSPPVTGVGQSVVPRLAITKTAPATATVKRAVRYRIVVRNASKVAAKTTVLRDLIPSGMSFVRASRAETLSNGALVFNLGTIAAGKSKVVLVWLRADADVRGRRTNVATATAAGAARVTARAATVFRGIPRRVQPAVTG